MGATHFLTKTMDRVSTEMSLHVLAYNLKRVMKIIGIGALMEVGPAFVGLESSRWRWRTNEMYRRPVTPGLR